MSHPDLILSKKKNVAAAITFGVGKLNEKGLFQQRIMVLDFTNRVLYNTKGGKVRRVFQFDHISDGYVDGENAFCAFIVFTHRRSPYELYFQSAVNAASFVEHISIITTNREKGYGSTIVNIREFYRSYVYQSPVYHVGKKLSRRKFLQLTMNSLRLFKSEVSPFPEAELLIESSAVIALGNSHLRVENIWNSLIIRTTGKNYNLWLNSIKSSICEHLTPETPLDTDIIKEIVKKEPVFQSLSIKRIQEFLAYTHKLENEEGYLSVQKISAGEILHRYVGELEEAKRLSIFKAKDAVEDAIDEPLDERQGFRDLEESISEDSGASSSDDSSEDDNDGSDDHPLPIDGDSVSENDDGNAVPSAKEDMSENTEITRSIAEIELANGPTESPLKSTEKEEREIESETEEVKRVPKENKKVESVITPSKKLTDGEVVHFKDYTGECEPKPEMGAEMVMKSEKNGFHDHSLIDSTIDVDRNDSTSERRKLNSRLPISSATVPLPPNSPIIVSKRLGPDLREISLDSDDDRGSSSESIGLRDEKSDEIQQKQAEGFDLRVEVREVENPSSSSETDMFDGSTGGSSYSLPMDPHDSALHTLVMPYEFNMYSKKGQLKHVRVQVVEDRLGLSVSINGKCVMPLKKIKELRIGQESVGFQKNKKVRMHSDRQAFTIYSKDSKNFLDLESSSVQLTIEWVSAMRSLLEGY